MVDGLEGGPGGCGGGAGFEAGPGDGLGGEEGAVELDGVVGYGDGVEDGGWRRELVS